MPPVRSVAVSSLDLSAPSQPSLEPDRPTPPDRRNQTKHPARLPEQICQQLLAIGHFFARRRGMVAEEAEDCAREFVVLCLQAVQQLSQPYLATWFQQAGRRKELCRLADNHAHDCARRHRNYDRYFGSRLTHPDDQRCLIQQALQTAPLSQRVIHQERMAQIHGALQRLPPAERDLFAACYDRGESAVEIAAFLE